MDFITKIRFCLKSADDIEREWETVRSTKIELESQRQKNQIEIENIKNDIQNLEKKQKIEFEGLQKKHGELLNAAFHNIELEKMKFNQKMQEENDALQKRKQGLIDEAMKEIELERVHNNEIFQLHNNQIKSREFDLEYNKKEFEYREKKYDEDFQKRIIQLDMQKKEIAELKQNIINEKNAIEPAWQEIRNENFKIFNEKKSISLTWKAINDEWQKLLEFHPELKQEISDKNVAAIMGQEHKEESFKGIDPEVIHKMHQKETKITSGGEDTIRYIRKDHPDFHGHKEK